jgi:hypothetical protein
MERKLPERVRAEGMHRDPWDSLQHRQTKESGWQV